MFRSRRAHRMVLLILVMAVGVLLLVLVVFATLRRDEALAVGAEWPRNVAHRGASSSSPENTLEAFRRAREAGAGGLELDVHLSSDGHVVVIHDESLGRTTDGSGAVRDATLEELRSLDAGYRFVPGGIPDLGSSEGREGAGGRGEKHPYRGMAARIPTLREVLEEFPEMRINLDIKEATPGIEKAVLEEIDRVGARDRVLVASIASEKGPVISRFRALSGGRVPTAASRLEVARFYVLSLLRLEGLADPPYDALQVPVEHLGVELVTERFVQAAHSRGVRVDVWTIDDPAEMRRLLDLGADSIMTNRPGKLQRVLEDRDSTGE